MSRFVLCILGCLIVSLVASAQLPTSTLNGIVTDPQGGVVVSAKVVITSSATGASRETTTGGDGSFAVTDLTPGDYTVRVSASGFATNELKGIRLEVGRASTLNVSLKIAKAGEVVEVIAGAIAVNTTQSMVQGQVESEAIETLPLNGRNFLDLAFLLPGNRPAPRFDPTKTNTVEVSSAGAYGRGGNIIIDGADNNDEVVGGTLMNFPEDGLAEFQIATKFTAEVGRSSSSIINVATKSGTNNVRGSEYIFFRHKDLQGLPATFDRRQPTPRFAREQFGGSLGGPFVRDKFFGFLAMEYLNQDDAVPVGIRSFTTNSLLGGSADAFVHDVRITSKGDWVPDEKDHISLRYSFERSLDVDNGFQIRPLGGAANRQQSLNRYNSFLASWSKSLSYTKVNTVSYQKNYFLNNIPAFSPNDPVTNPGGLALGNELRFPSLQDGANYRIPQRTRLARDQVRDTFYWSLGKHNLSFGGEFQYYGSDILFDIFGSGSVFLAQDFATQDLNSDGVINDLDIPIAIALKSGAPVRPPTAPYEHNHYLGLFVQDDWRFRPGLTINAGLRWDGDFNSLGETEQNKPCPSLTTASINCEFIRNLLGPHNSSAKYKNFGPRVGFAWQPSMFKNTVVRGGYGIYYDRIILEPALLEELLNGRAVPIVAFGGSTCFASGSGSTPTPSLGNCFLSGATYAASSPTLASPFSGGSSPFGIGVNVVDNKAATPLVQQFTLGVQHQFENNYLLSVDGILTRGTRQLVPRFLRTLPPEASAAASTYIDCPNPRDPCTVIDPAHGTPAATGCFPPPGTSADPSCQQITDIRSSARTWYDAMLVSFQKRPHSGPWHPGYNVSYTLSKTFDEQPDDQVSPSGAPTEDPAIVAMHVDSLKIEKGYATSDERHRFVLSGIMEVPWKLNVSPIWTWASSIPENLDVPALGDGRLPNIPRNALGRQIQNGAQLNAVIIAYNALPACLASGSTAGPVPCNEGKLLNAAGTGPFQVDPKLHFGHSLNSFDTRITRTFHFKEPHSLEAIAEVFNLFNITNIRGTTNRNYSGVNNVLTSSDFNRSLETAGKFFGAGGPRAFQFALRYSF